MSQLKLLTLPTTPGSFVHANLANNILSSIPHHRSPYYALSQAVTPTSHLLLSDLTFLRPLVVPFLCPRSLYTPVPLLITHVLRTLSSRKSNLSNQKSTSLTFRFGLGTGINPATPFQSSTPHLISILRSQYLTLTLLPFIRLLILGMAESALTVYFGLEMNMFYLRP
jgi:hypothetical protein